MEQARTSVGILGGGPRELELMLELQGSNQVDLVGIYDPDPFAPALALAEILGVPHGSNDEALERLATAPAVVLPADRRSMEDAVRWAGGLRSELVSMAEAQRRWGTSSPGPADGVPPCGAGNSTERALQDAVDLSARLQDRSELADWLLGLAMHAVDATGGSIQALAAATGELYLVAARGLSERLVRLGRHRVGEGISGSVAASRTAQIVIGPKPGRIVRERADVHASISVPLEDASGLVGVLNVSSNVAGRRFTEAHLDALERLAPRIARLLRMSELAAPTSPRLELARIVRRFEVESLDLPTRLWVLCDHVRELLGADTAVLYLATEDGAWLRVVPIAKPSAAGEPSVRRSALDSALVERRSLHRPAPSGPGAPEDVVASAVERALDPQAITRSQLYVPLAEMEPAGVLFLEFAALGIAERALRDGEALVEQLTFALEAQLRIHHEAERAERFAALARALRRLLDRPAGEPIDAPLARECARLVGGRRVIVRRVDERHRTYSRPVTHGIAEEALDRWRSVDARITVQTLQARHAVVSTITDESDPDVPTPRRYSLLSLPLFHTEQIVAVVNVFEKQARDCLDTNTFTRFDRELLEGLATVVGPSLADAPAPAGEMAPPAAEPARTASPGALPAAAPEPSAPLPAAEPALPPENAPPAADAGEESPPADPNLQAAFEDEIVRAASEKRGVGLWVLRFEGLEGLGATSQSVRDSLHAALRLAVHGPHFLDWVGSDRLVLLGPSSAPGDATLGERVVGLLQPILAAHAAPQGSVLELHLGRSSYPQDGADVRALLATAAARAR